MDDVSETGSSTKRRRTGKGSRSKGGGSRSAASTSMKRSKSAGSSGKRSTGSKGRRGGGGAHAMRRAPSLEYGMEMGAVIDDVTARMEASYTRQLNMLRSQMAQLQAQVQQNAATMPPMMPAAPAHVTLDDNVTYQDKKKLSQDIEKLDEDTLKNVISLIHERTPLTGTNSDPNYFEIDLDVLDSATIRELQKMVERANAKRAKNKRGRGRKPAGLSPIRRGGLGKDVAKDVYESTTEKMELLKAQMGASSTSGSELHSGIMHGESSSDDDDGSDSDSDDALGSASVGYY